MLKVRVVSIGAALLRRIENDDDGINLYVKETTTTTGQQHSTGWGRVGSRVRPDLPDRVEEFGTVTRPHLDYLSGTATPTTTCTLAPRPAAKVAVLTQSNRPGRKCEDDTYLYH